MTGCASPATREAMSAQNLTLAKKHPYDVSVNTRGGNETSAMDSSNISDADLKAAIESSIAESKLFKSVIQEKGGDYELSVTVTQMSKPIIGASFTVDLETGWSLVKTSDQSVAMRKVIKSSHTATMGDSLLGAARLRMAVEGAARKNIAEGLAAISALDL
jgi:hypothetical protein